METKPSPDRLSAELSQIIALCKQDELTYGELAAHLERRGVLLFILVLSLPFLLSAPGLSMPFGVLVAAAALRGILGYGIWIPHRWQDKKIPARIFVRALTAVRRIFRALEAITRKRGEKMLSKPAVGQASLIIIAACALLLALPLPPGTNFPPALAIVLLTVGLLEGDIVFACLGAAAFALTVALFGGLLVLGVQGLGRLFGA